MSSRFLVDTDVISELRKRERCDAGVASWYGDLSEEQIFLSVMTLGEIRKGIESIRRRDIPSADSLDAWLRRLERAHAARILPVDGAVAEEWGRLNVPDPLPVVDGLLAATAKVHGLTLATGNVKDVARSRVPCIDPFSRNG